VREIRAKNGRIIKNKTLLVTVDIGKSTNTGYWRTPNGAEARPFEFGNNGWGFNKFWNCVHKAMQAHHLEEVVMGYESTGPYGEPLWHYMRKRGVTLLQVNPMHTKRVKELQGNSPNKTDKKDPKVIADIIELGHALTVIVPEGAAANLRRLTQARERALVRRTALLNTLQNLVFIIFPEFLQVIKNVASRSAKYLLKHCPSPQDVMTYGVEKLAAELKKVSRGKFGDKQAQTLYLAAADSVGVLEGQTGILLEIRESLKLIDKSDQFIAEVEAQIQEQLKAIPYSRFITSIKGVKEITAAGLIGEVGDFAKFKNAKEMEKLAGLDLYECSSGKHKGKRRISKRGRSLLRKILYFAALSVIRKGGILHQWYQKALSRGMLKMKALVGAARKLLGIIFALVRDHSEYVSGYQKTRNLSLEVAA
jgi:transposase